MRTQEHRSRRSRALGLALALTLIGAALAAQTHHSDNSTTVIQQRGASSSQSQVTTYPDGQKVITRDSQSTDISIQRRSAGTPARSAEDHDGLGERLAPSRGWERLAPRRPAAADALGRPAAGLSHEVFRLRMLERMDRRERF